MTSLAYRWMGHLKASIKPSSNSPLYRSIKEYGINHHHIEIFACPRASNITKMALETLEYAIIQQFTNNKLLLNKKLKKR